MDILFRKVEIYETTKLASLAKEIWIEHFTSIIGSEQVAYMIEKFQSEEPTREQINGIYDYYYFLKENSPVGYICIKNENGNMFLSKLYLLKSERGKGYASKAMDFLVDICKKEALTKIWLTVNKYNEKTISVYEHLGFKTTREQIQDIGNGFFMDDYIMEKNI